MPGSISVPTTYFRFSFVNGESMCTKYLLTTNSNVYYVPSNSWMPDLFVMFILAIQRQMVYGFGHALVADLIVPFLPVYNMDCGSILVLLCKQLCKFPCRWPAPRNRWSQHDCNIVCWDIKPQLNNTCH